ncbi:protein chibby homolog 1 isoform X3 [Orussus abietinus]|uniref:protein chibby homolog 1 isoform X3 n=1 Tax=Orussus abietinus TaxID=222816 RepID=UPI000C7160C2|nr:protein chibby homolog 1 isoform X3 [Orussus abietinus]
MPLFSNKFSPKKTPTRKVGPVRICLGNQKAVFEDGQWIPESGKAAETFKENERLHIEMKKLREENNLLKLKLEVLLDMTLTLQLSRTTAESQIQDRRSNESNYDKRDVT